MLSEFAITPAIFDEDAHDDKEAWSEQLRELTSALFPRTSVWPVLISNLYAGSWSSHILEYIDRIGDHRAKKYCQGLVTNMRRMLVIRPECGEWPSDDDSAWCREAIATHAVEPIDRIISVRQTISSHGNDISVVRCIDEVEDGGFWHDIKADASPRMVIAEQVELLRKLCIHSEWVALINPYGFGNEQNFSLQLLEFALNRHASFGPIHFEFHAQAPDVTDPVERQERQDRVLNNIANRIRPKLNGSHSVNLYFWPRLLDRIIVAGNFVTISGGERRKSPRWGVSMNHVALGSDPDTSSTEWKLLRRERLNEWFRQFVSEDASDKPTPAFISAVS